MLKPLADLKKRLQDLELDFAALNRRYCKVRQAKGDKSATSVNRRNMLAKAISDDGNPTLETFMDIVEALQGQVNINWKKPLERNVMTTEFDRKGIEYIVSAIEELKMTQAREGLSSRERALAITNLEQALLWLNKDVVDEVVSRELG